MVGAKSKKSRRLGIDAEDSRPVASPFKNDMVQLEFGQETTYTVHRGVLDKVPLMLDDISFSSLSIQDIAPEAGHVLVQYLYSQRYECLRPKGSSAYERLVNEFTTSVQVYALARRYAIENLHVLARNEIEKLGKQLQIEVVVNTLQSNYPTLKETDAWMADYFKARIQALFQQDEVPSSHEETDHYLPGRGLSICSIFVKKTMEVIHENARAQKNQEHPGNEKVAEAADVLEESALVMPKPSLGQDVVPEAGNEKALWETCEQLSSQTGSDLAAGVKFPEPEPEVTWDVPVTKKSKKIKKKIIEPVEKSVKEVKPCTEPQEEFWAFLVTDMKNKKKKGDALPEEPCMEEDVLPR